FPKIGRPSYRSICEQLARYRANARRRFVEVHLTFARTDKWGLTWKNRACSAAGLHNRHGCDIPGPHGTEPLSLPSRGSHDRFLAVHLAVPTVSVIVPILDLPNRP